MTDDDAIQQRITFLLQEIDENICASHRCATRILTKVRKQHQIMRKIHSSLQIWSPLFNQMLIPKTIIEDQEDHVRLTSDAKQHTSTIQIEETHQISFTESVTHVEIDAIRQETLHPTLKTCELKEYKTSVQETLTNVSIDSDKLPSMRTTPYIKRHSLFEKQYSESHDTSQHTPVLSSPPHTQLKVLIWRDFKFFLLESVLENR